MDQSNRSIGVDYISIFHPNNPPLVLGMLAGCVATDTSSSNLSLVWILVETRVNKDGYFVVLNYPC